MIQHRTRKLLFISLLVIAVLVGLPLAGQQLAEQERAQRLQERIAAETLWAQAKIDRYTLTIDANSCHYVARVRSDKATISGLQQLSCIAQPSSVTNLFAMLKRDGVIARLCDTRGCPCESLTTARGIYDPQRGYPTQINVDVDLHPAWLTADLWKNMFADLALPPCISHTISTIRVVQFQLDH
jgi:hypothetical protein